jgi:autotransporter-associated beta strand protein
MSRAPVVAFAFAVLAFAPAAFSQTFVSQGPAPSIGPAATVQSGDGPDGQTGTVSGAVQAIVVSPTDAGTMYIGAVNGGVWATHNGGASWTPLGDNQRSLSISSLAMDPGNPNVLVAGTGLVSNGAFADPSNVANRGGARIGLLLSNNGGESWSEAGGATLAGKSIVGVAVRGSTILAAAAEPNAATAAGGLFISDNGGGSFQPVTLGSGGGTVAVTALAADPGNRNVFYAAVNSTVAADRGVYVSGNTGASWTKALDLAPGQIARLATGPDGSVVAAVYAPANVAQPDSNNRLVALMLSKAGGAAGTWVNLGAPNVNPGGQASTDLAVAIDRGNPNIVYVAGDAKEGGNPTLAAYRVTLNADGTTTTVPLTDSFTSNTTVHADVRNFAFDANGRLIMVGDGGVYALSDPQGPNGVWAGLNSTLAIREAYAIAYDAISKRLVVASQDTGVAFQNAPNSAQYEAIGQGDGLNAVVNDKTLRGQGESAIYTSSQGLDPLQRRIVDAQGRTIANTTLEVQGYAADDFTDESEERPAEKSLPFSSKIVLNRIDPSMIAFGTNYVYTAVDPNASADTLHLTNLGPKIGPVTALAYGTQDNINALLAGSAGGLFLSATAAPGSLQHLAGYGGGAPTSVVFDPRTMARFYAADTTAVWGTTDTGGSFSDISLSTLTRPTALEFISSNGVNALLVGGVNNTVNAQSPIAVADSDGNGTLSPWRAFGFGLPNTIANQLVYNPEADVLAVSLWGRGAWLLYDVTAYFPSALVLRFGLADNDSAPPDSILTNGDYASRNLEKVGTGTLTIDGTTSYSGTTSVLGGRLIANGNLTSSSALFVDAPGTLAGTGIVPTTTVSGVLAPGNPTGNLTVAGNLTFNPGSAYQVALAGTSVAARANVTGAAALAGTVEASFSGAGLARSYTILSAAGGLSGSFQGLASSGLPGFFETGLGYSTTDVTLNLQSAMAGTPGLGGDQISVARVLDSAFNAGPGWGAMPALFGLSTGQLPAALSMLSGDNASVGQSMEIAAGNQFVTLLGNRAGTVPGGVGPGAGQTVAVGAQASAAAPCGESFCELPRDWSAWAAGFGGGQWLSADPLAGSSAAQQSTGGGAVGIDYHIDADTRAGFGAGFSESSYWVSGTGALGRATGAHFGLYGRHDWRGFYLAAAVAYSHFDGNATRPITGIGNTETARSYASSHELGGRLEVGHPFDVATFPDGRVGITPLVALQPTQLWTPGTAETSVTQSGAPGVFALDYRPAATTSLPLFVGAQLDLQRPIDGRPLEASLRASWVHEFMTSRGVTAGFTALPGTSFIVDGARAASDAARLDLGLSYALGERTSLFASASAELSGRSQSIAGTAGVKFSW